MLCVVKLAFTGLQGGIMVHHYHHILENKYRSLWCIEPDGVAAWFLSWHLLLIQETSKQ